MPARAELAVPVLVALVLVVPALVVPALAAPVRRPVMPESAVALVLRRASSS